MDSVKPTITLDTKLPELDINVRMLLETNNNNKSPIVVWIIWQKFIYISYDTLCFYFLK